MLKSALINLLDKLKLSCSNFFFRLVKVSILLGLIKVSMLVGLVKVSMFVVLVKASMLVVKEFQFLMAAI